MTRFLIAQFGLDDADLFRPAGPVNLVRLMQVPDWVDRPDLKFAPSIPACPNRSPKGSDIFAALRKGDILPTTPTSPSPR